jgi:hypothetical protein
MDQFPTLSTSEFFVNDPMAMGMIQMTTIAGFNMKTNCHKLHMTIFLSIQVCISTNLDELVLMSVLPLCSHVGGSWHRV